jgi:hypothetical protein
MIWKRATRGGRGCELHTLGPLQLKDSASSFVLVLEIKLLLFEDEDETNRRQERPAS